MQPDFNKMMRDAQQSLQKMQQDVKRMQEELSATKIEGTAGGGAVTVVCNGQQEFSAVRISPEAVDPDDIETLEDLILAAIKDATTKTQALVSEKSGSVTSGLNLPPGLGL